jgi:hypothetical protein
MCYSSNGRLEPECGTRFGNYRLQTYNMAILFHHGMEGRRLRSELTDAGV